MLLSSAERADIVIALHRSTPFPADHVEGIPPMIIGVPTEIKDSERRVGMTPTGVDELSAHGHRVLIQSGAGVGSGFGDDAYRAAGAEIVAEAAANIAVAFLKGETPEAKTTLYNTPSELFVPAVVTRENIKAEIFDKGIQTVEEVCTADYADACRELGILK